MDDDQNESISKETEEKHEVKEDGQVGAQEVITLPATRSYRCGVLVLVIIIGEIHQVFHLQLNKNRKAARVGKKRSLLQAEL